MVLLGFSAGLDLGFGPGFALRRGNATELVLIFAFVLRAPGFTVVMPLASPFDCVCLRAVDLLFKRALIESLPRLGFLRGRAMPICLSERVRVSFVRSFVRDFTSDTDVDGCVCGGRLRLRTTAVAGVTKCTTESPWSDTRRRSPRHQSNFFSTRLPLRVRVTRSSAGAASMRTARSAAASPLVPALFDRVLLASVEDSVDVRIRSTFRTDSRAACLLRV